MDGVGGWQGEKVQLEMCLLAPNFELAKRLSWKMPAGNDDGHVNFSNASVEVYVDVVVHCLYVHAFSK